MSKLSLIDSASNLPTGIKQLRDLIIDLHYQADPWYKTWAPYLIALGVGLLTIAGQWFLFWLTKRKELEILKINTKKEINIKVAELYGKYKAQSVTYNIIFFRYNKADVAYKHNLFMNNHLRQIIEDDEQRAELGPSQVDDLFDQYKNYTEQTNSLSKTADEEFELFKVKKAAVIELLHQIHFYYVDSELENLINDFENTFTHKFAVTQFNKDMSKSSYLETYYDINIKPLNVILKEQLDKISAQILVLAKK